MIIERMYATATTLQFPLVAWSLTSLYNSCTTSMFAAGDFQISLDGGNYGNTATLPSACPSGFDVVLSLTAAEITARRIAIRIVDQSVPKVWEDQYLLIETYGTTSAMHAFNRNQTTVAASLTAAQTGVTVATVTDITNTVKASLTAAQVGVTIATVTDITNTVKASLTASQVGVTLATVTNVTNGVNLTTTAILNNFAASATAQINAEVASALAAASVTAAVMNRVMTNLDVAVSTRSTFNPATSGVSLTAAQVGVTIATVTDITNTVKASLTAAQVGVTLATVTNVTNGVNLTSTAILNNLGASATAQINAECDTALADASVTANAMNKIHTPTQGADAMFAATLTSSSFDTDTFGSRASNLDAAVSSRSLFNSVTDPVTVASADISSIVAGVTSPIINVISPWRGTVTDGSQVNRVILGSGTISANANDDYYTGNIIHIVTQLNPKAKAYRITGYVGGSREVILDRTVEGAIFGSAPAWIVYDTTESVGTDKTGYALSSTGNDAAADALLDRTDGIETSWTLRKATRVMFSVMAGKLSGAATTAVAIRDVGDTKDRVAATVDSNGNRTAVTLDGD